MFHSNPHLPPDKKFLCQSQRIHTTTFFCVHMSISDLFSKTLKIISEGMLVLRYPICTSLKKHCKLSMASPWLQFLLTEMLGPKAYPVEQQNTNILNHAVESHVLEHAKWGHESCTSFSVWEKKEKRNEVSDSVLFSWAQETRSKAWFFGYVPDTMGSLESVGRGFQERPIAVHGPQALTHPWSQM